MGKVSDIMDDMESGVDISWKWGVPIIALPIAIWLIIKRFSNKSLVITDKNIVFPKLKRPVSLDRLVKVERDEMRDCTHFIFKGGVDVCIKNEDWKCKSEVVLKGKERQSPLGAFDEKEYPLNKRAFIEKVTRAENPRKEVKQACEDYVFARVLFGKLKADEAVDCSLYPPADAYDAFMSACKELPNCDALIGADLQEKMRSTARFWASQLPSCKEEETKARDRQLFARLMLHAGHAPTTPTETLEHYDLSLNLRAQGDQRESDAKLLENRLNLLKALGSPSFAPLRKTIICQEISSSDQRDCGKTVLGVAVLLAQDIELYNARQTSPEMKLRFQSGHPRNGFTYVQHPLRPNVYYDVDAFHAMMLESKHSELMYLLRNLGAKQVCLSVVNTVEEKEKEDDNIRVSAEGKAKGASGSIDVKMAEFKKNNSSLYQKFAATSEFTGNVTPHIPEDLVFFPHEEQWQRMAQTALERGYSRTHVTLEYRQDYAISQRHLSEVETQLRSLIPSFDMHIKADFAKEVKSMSELVWDYEVKW